MVIQGPAFLTGEVSFAGGALTRSKVKEIPGSGNQEDPDDLNAQDGLSGKDHKVDRYLNFFVLDLADRTVSSAGLAAPPGGTVGGQSSISISETTPCPILGKPDPYAGTFRVLAMSVLGAKDNRQYGEEALRVIAEATVTTKIVGRTVVWTTREDTIFKTRRRY
jgi:hypothetical protein